MMFTDDTPPNHISPAKSGDANESLDSNRPIAIRRRGFLKNFGLSGLALSAGALLTARGRANAAFPIGPTPGDVAILRLLAAAELIEADLWQQYAELGGLTPG